MLRNFSIGCLSLAVCLLAAPLHAAVFAGIEYGRDGESELLLDVRTPAKPGPFPVWVEWVEPGASPLIVADREVRSTDTVLIRAVMPPRAAARTAAVTQLMSWLPQSVSGYGGDPERAILIVRGAGAQAVLDLWKQGAAQPEPPRGVRAMVLVEPPANLRGHRDWPDLPVLLVDAPGRSDALWRTALRLRNLGIAAEPSVQGGPASASPGLSTQIAGMLAASDVRRVQRFDQLAFDTPIALAGDLLDAVDGESGLLALLRDRRAKAVLLSAIDEQGALREVRRWPWRDDARLLKLDAGLMAVGSDAGGRPHAAFSRAGAVDWQELPLQAPTGRLRSRALAQRGSVGLVLAWSQTTRGGPTRSWLQRIEWSGDVPRIARSRMVERNVGALAFAGDDVIVADTGDAPSASSARMASLMRWSRDDAWTLVPGSSGAPWDALVSLSPDASGPSRPSLLGERAGRLHSIDLTCRPICVEDELDIASLGEGGPNAAIKTSTSGRWLLHPETGETLLALLPWSGTRRHQAVAPSWLIRQQNGRYGIARLPDARGVQPHALKAILPWPGTLQRNRFALFGSSGEGTLLFPARLQRASIMPGLWWDRTRSGHGFELRRSGEEWQVTVFTFDRLGMPVWYRGNGDIREGRWQADDDGLLSYRLAPGSNRVEIDRSSVQALEMVFAEGGQGGECRAAARPRASALALASLVIGETRSEFCIEPLRLAPSGRPAVDADGVWSHRDEPAPWQLSLTTQGHDPRARIGAFLTYFDRDGASRWAYAVSDWRRGNVDLQLLAVRGACPACKPRKPSTTPVGDLSLRVSGECGNARATASLRVSHTSGAIGIRKGPVELAPSAALGCY